MDPVQRDNEHVVDPHEQIYRSSCRFLSANLSSNGLPAQSYQGNDKPKPKPGITIDRHIKPCLTDAFALFRAQHQNPVHEVSSPSSNLRVLKFISEYAHAILREVHICGREFEFVSKNFYNKASLVRLIRRTFKHIEPKRNIRRADFVQLLARICPNIPNELVKVSFTCACFAEKSCTALEDRGCDSKRLSATLGTSICSFSLWIALSPFFRVCCSYLRGELFPETSPGATKTHSIWRCSMLVGQARTLLLEVHGEDLRFGNDFFKTLDEEIKQQWQPTALVPAQEFLTYLSTNRKLYKALLATHVDFLQGWSRDS